MIDISFSTAADSKLQKLDAWRDALARAFGPIEVQRNCDEEFAGSVRAQSRAQLQFNEICYRGQTLERTAQNIAKFDQEYFTFGRPVSGPLLFKQKDREFTVEPGCLVLTNQTAPYKATAISGYHAFSISIPRKLLLNREPNIGSFYKLDAGEGSPRGQLLATFAKHMTDGIAGWSETETISLREQMLDLIVLLMINGKNGYASAQETSIKSAHRERAIAYIRHHHRDAALTPKTIALACGISVNYLHKVFQAANMQVEHTIYAQRLESCKIMLRDPAHQKESVQQIAYKTGFNQPSHLSRMFKEKFGLSPSDFRISRAPGAVEEHTVASV